MSKWTWSPGYSSLRYLLFDCLGPLPVCSIVSGCHYGYFIGRWWATNNPIQFCTKPPWEFPPLSPILFLSFWYCNCIDYKVCVWFRDVWFFNEMAMPYAKCKSGMITRNDYQWFNSGKSSIISVLGLQTWCTKLLPSGPVSETVSLQFSITLPPSSTTFSPSFSYFPPLIWKFKVSW